MAESTFNIGDVVRLRSGGMDMTVTRVQEAFVSCSWMNHRGSLVEGAFPPISLVRAPNFGESGTHITVDPTETGGIEFSGRVTRKDLEGLWGASLASEARSPSDVLGALSQIFFKAENQKHRNPGS